MKKVSLVISIIGFILAGLVLAGMTYLIIPNILASCLSQTQLSDKEYANLVLSLQMQKYQICLIILAITLLITTILNLFTGHSKKEPISVSIEPHVEEAKPEESSESSEIMENKV